MASAESASTADDRPVLVAHEHSSTCNHRPATANILLSAAKAGDVEALRDAISRGQSTEEATEVRWRVRRVRHAARKHLWPRRTGAQGCGGLQETATKNAFVF